MEVVILAAGRGTRLGQDERPHISYVSKPLLPLNGETIIQRQVRLLKELKITNTHQGTPMSIKIVAGENKLDIKKLIPDAEFMETNTNHNNALYELAEVCGVTKEKETLLVLLGDLIFSKDALKEMIEYNTLKEHHHTDNSYITVYGSFEPTTDTWWNRGGEIFAVKLQQLYIQKAHTLLKTMPLLDYQLKNIPKQLNLSIHPIKECCDVDQPPDYAHALLTLHKHDK